MKGLTDEEVELEIARLKEDPDVQLAKLEERIRYRRRQYLYCLRNYQKKGQALREAGVTTDMLRGQADDMGDGDFDD